MQQKRHFPSLQPPFALTIIVSRASQKEDVTTCLGSREDSRVPDSVVGGMIRKSEQDTRLLQGFIYRCVQHRNGGEVGPWVSAGVIF